MDVIALARSQFAITTIYHFLFVPLTLGLSVMVAYMETMYVKTNDDTYKKMTKFWGKLFLINFAIGVVTGIVQEFQFGMNWAEYSRFVGDIFGAPLAIEALLAFFIESTFIGIWIFGWDKISKKLHLACIWIVAIASNISALWIIIANAFMQHPVGFTINNGRAEMTDFWAVITNSNVFLQFPHTVLSAMATSAVFIMGISAYHLLKRQNRTLFTKSLKIALVFGFISIMATVLIGDASGKHLMSTQPMKMASAEALWETTEKAPFAIIASIDEENQTNNFELEVPAAFSYIAYGDYSAEVKGIKELAAQMEAEHGPGNYIPPVTVTFWAFRIMLFTGIFMFIVMGIGILLWICNGFNSVFYLKCLFFMIPIPFITNSAGWVLTEMGRQPWLVYNIQTLEEGISKSVTSGQVMLSLLLFTIVYGILAVIEIGLLVKFIKMGPDFESKMKIEQEEGSLWI